MSKSILKSLRPKTVANILNGNAILFISKDIRLYKATMKLIEEQDYATFFMYCTKDKSVLKGVSSCAYLPHPRMDGKSMMRFDKDFPVLNGKVVAKFTLRKVEEIVDYGSCYLVNKDYPHTNEVARGSCLDFVDLKNYLKGKNGYAYHIEDLVIFDKPKELSEFRTYDKFNNKGLCYESHTLTNAPQNFCYVESEE